MRFRRFTAAVVGILLLASCNGGGSAVNTSESTKAVTDTQSELLAPAERVTAHVTTPAPESEPVRTTKIITTAETTTTTAQTTTAETTTVTTTATTTTATPVPPPADGVTSTGHTITTVDGVTYVDGTLIANKTYALPETYAPGGLTEDTYAAFMQMQSAASAEGLYIFVKSGYRSFYDQRYIYNGYAASDGQALADRYSARAGHSEHQSGMAIDVNSTMNSFADTPEGIWLKNNCYKYGFIIRYPEGKEHITGYMYEPWHVRYLGVELATAVTESGLTLEEYFGITSSYS